MDTHNDNLIVVVNIFIHALTLRYRNIFLIKLFYYLFSYASKDDKIVNKIISLSDFI